MPCSNVNAVTMTAPPKDFSMELGTTFLVTGRFSTDGSGDSCPQVMNWNVQKVGGSPASFGNEAAASEDFEYTRACTAIDSVGDWDVWVQVLWGTDGSGAPEFNETESEKVRVTVIGKNRTEATIDDTDRTASVEDRTADASAEPSTAKSSVGDRSVVSGLESRSVGAGE